MKRIVLAATLVLALPLTAQDPKLMTTAPLEVVTTPAAAPVISDALKAQFFKAQSFVAQADVSAEKAHVAYQAAIDELKRTCGEGANLQSDKAGDPVCVVKPPVAEKK